MDYAWGANGLDAIITQVQRGHGPECLLGEGWAAHPWELPHCLDPRSPTEVKGDAGTASALWRARGQLRPSSCRF